VSLRLRFKFQAVLPILFFWHRAGPVILELILPIHILKRATRWLSRFFHEQDARSCSRWRAIKKRCAVSLGSAPCL